jgi:hypothetical protein
MNLQRMGKFTIIINDQNKRHISTNLLLLRKCGMPHPTPVTIPFLPIVGHEGAWTTRIPFSTKKVKSSWKL